ncbi:hypothetical protein HU200_017203 [Digitaria exilis]|uniref:Uncharacterized protein n=1 Tax=Digitaria exilis TaxID=1010633 RepID=A0A835F6Y5_9POAL|nr:hypothetical protein HU200_017203 [Digitaria exilis]
MRTNHMLLAVIALLLVSSGVMAKVSTRCKQHRSVIMYPAKRCDPQSCKTNCAKQYNHGVGTCMYPNGCDCEYCGLDDHSRHSTKKSDKVAM